MNEQEIWEVLSSNALMPNEAKIESPIERAFYRCYCYLALGFPPEQRLPILCQVKVESYRIDFVITDFAGNRLVAVECDGHDFHERTKQQAAKDRSRDRALLAKHKLPVMRFTGSEIYAHAFSYAAEAMQFALSANRDRQATNA